MGHGVLLLSFCLLIVTLWMMPVILAGFPPSFTSVVKSAHMFVRTGVLDHALSPLFLRLLLTLLPVLDWRDATLWALVSAITLALATIPLWWCIRRLFNPSLAWISVILFCLLPMYWKEAISTGYYPLSLLCLFSGFALFLFCAPRHRLIGVIALGMSFGLTVSTSHAFVTFLPWFLCVYLWERRTAWRKAVLELMIFGGGAYVAFILPLLPLALQPELSLRERLSVLLPIEQNLMPPSELYGDDFAYLYLRKEFDERMHQSSLSDSFIERRNNENYRINYGVGSFGIFGVLLNSSWLFFNASSSLFMQEMVGGFFLWLFLIPGAISLWRTHKRLLLQLLGLWLSMEIVLRFGFHYTRIHLMNVGWIIALIAAAGVMTISDAMQKTLRMRYTSIVTCIIVLLVGLQLLQENRKILAHEYIRSSVPKAKAAAEALKEIAPLAIIAEPAGAHLLIFSDRSSIPLNPTTIAVLQEHGRLAEPFTLYHITHIIGFDPLHTALIQSAVPTIKNISFEANPRMQLSAFQRYLLNLIR